MDIKIGNGRSLTVKAVNLGETKFIPVEDEYELNRLHKILTDAYWPVKELLEKNNYVIMRVEDIEGPKVR